MPKKPSYRPPPGQTTPTSPSLAAAAGEWDHAAAVARTLPVRAEFEQPALAPFDSHLFWGSWKWVGWYATEFTWVGRWIMHSVVRGDVRAIPLCIDWMKGTRFPEQAAVLAYAVQRLSGEPARPPRQWVRWYEGGLLSKGAKLRYPDPNLNAWLADLKREFPEKPERANIGTARLRLD